MKAPSSVVGEDWGEGEEPLIRLGPLQINERPTLVSASLSERGKKRASI
jgi:hypothetical protein